MLADATPITAKGALWLLGSFISKPFLLSWIQDGFRGNRIPDSLQISDLVGRVFEQKRGFPCSC